MKTKDRLEDIEQRLFDLEKPVKCVLSGKDIYLTANRTKPNLCKCDITIKDAKSGVNFTLNFNITTDFVGRIMDAMNSSDKFLGGYIIAFTVDEL